MMLLGSVILLVHSLGAFVASGFTTIVETSSGPVRGALFTTVNSFRYAAFKGIRYAQPPVGGLRFMRPVAVVPWTKTQAALRYGNKCPQLDVNSQIIGDEDCLFLNVFTPTTNLRDTPTELKPVMVWIHEGTFADGSGEVSIKRPDYLLERDVLFVSLNYRLGALGFLSLNEPGATGNQGLKDQNLALKWVQKNIAKFGGNPEKVTLFGKGAGAVSVGFHVLSTASGGLFHGAISMSGTPLAPHSFVSLSEAVRRGRELAAMVREESPTEFPDDFYLTDLRNAKPEQLVKNAQRVDPLAPFVPTIEDRTIASDTFLSENLMDIYESGNFNKVPQILGFTGLDTGAYLNLIRQTLKANKELFSSEIDLASLKAAILSCLDRGGNVSSFSVGAMRYRNTGLPPFEHDNQMMFYHPVTETRKLLVQKNGDKLVYEYRMAPPWYEQSPSRPTITGINININSVVYAEDLESIFYIPSKSHNPRFKAINSDFINKICKLWTDFAKYGNPDPSRMFWPASGSSGLILEINQEISIRSHLSFIEINWMPYTPIGRLRYFFESE